MILIFSKDAAEHFKMAFNATLEVKCSRELKVSGAIGACYSANKKDSSGISDMEIGMGGTTVLNDTLIILNVICATERREGKKQIEKLKTSSCAW